MKNIIKFSMVCVLMTAVSVHARYVRRFYNSTPYTVIFKVKIDVLGEQRQTVSPGQTWVWQQPFWQAYNLLKSVNAEIQTNSGEYYVAKEENGSILEPEERYSRQEYKDAHSGANVPQPQVRGYRAPLGVAGDTKFILMGPLGDQRNPYYQISRMANPEILQD